MQVEIKSIKVRKRIRKDLDDINELAESMSRFGQLHPITITRKNVLVSGMRRLQAAKALGWFSIEANVIGSADRAKQLEIEIEENTQRDQLTQEEIEQALMKLGKLRNPGFFRRIWNSIVRFFKRLFRIEDE